MTAKEIADVLAVLLAIDETEYQEDFICIDLDGVRWLYGAVKKYEGGDWAYNPEPKMHWMLATRCEDGIEIRQHGDGLSHHYVLSGDVDKLVGLVRELRRSERCLAKKAG